MYNCRLGLVGFSNQSRGFVFNAPATPENIPYGYLFYNCSFLYNRENTTGAAGFVEYNTIRDGVPVSTVGRPVNKNYPIGTVLTRWEALEFNPCNYIKGWDPLNLGEKLAKTDAALASVSIEIPDTAEATFPLPNSPEGVSFMWASNSPYIIIAKDLSAFTVTRPAQGEADIKGELTLYAKNDKNGLGDKRVFELVLLPVVK